MRRALATSITVLVAAAAAGALIAVAVPDAAERVRSSLALSLEARPASASVFPVLAVHNFVVCAWPLALRGLGLDRSRCLRIIFGIPVVLALLANGALVGLALGAYGLRLLAFLPHLPLEWVALAAGCAGWFGAGVRLRWIALLVAVAAAVETWAAPL